jgi:hypothetical protein
LTVFFGCWDFLIGTRFLAAPRSSFIASLNPITRWTLGGLWFRGDRFRTLPFDRCCRLTPKSHFLIQWVPLIMPI